MKLSTIVNSLFRFLSFTVEALFIGFDFGYLGHFIDPLAGSYSMVGLAHHDWHPRLVVGLVGLQTN